MAPLPKYDGRSQRPWFGSTHATVLVRIARLRVITIDQARFLLDPYQGLGESAVTKNLERLAAHGYLVRDLVEPKRGAVSRVFYRLTTKGGYRVLRKPKRGLFSRPTQHILKYLLFRNTVYAQARADGWKIGSPVYSSPGNFPEYVKLFNDWARRAYTDEVRRLQVGRAFGARIRAEEELARLDRFLPTKLTFEFLYKLHPTEPRASEIVLLIIDDPRRAIYRPTQPARWSATGRVQSIETAGPVMERRSRALPPRPGPLWDDLPIVSPPGLRLLLRDHLTRYDLVNRKTFGETRRLRKWRSMLSGERSIYGNLLERDTLWPELWATRVANWREIPLTVAPTGTAASTSWTGSPAIPPRREPQDSPNTPPREACRA